MGVLSWVLFWPETREKSVVFHVFRHLCIVMMVLLATRVHPSFFTVYLALVCLIEYSRRSKLSGLLGLYFTITFALCLLGVLNGHFMSAASPRALVADFLGSISLYAVVALDHLTVKRFGIASLISTLSFPLLTAGSCEFLGVMDPCGIAHHLSVLCDDYPAFTLPLFRLFGSGGAIFFVAFLAAYTSHWRVMKLVPRLLSVLLFQVLPILVMVMAVTRYFIPQNKWFVDIGLVMNTSKFLAQSSIPHRDMYVVMEAASNNITESFVRMATAVGSVVAFRYALGNDTYVAVALPNSTVQYSRVSDYRKRILPIRFRLEEMLVINSRMGRIGFLVGREMFKPEYFTSHDVDLLVTFGGVARDEQSGVAKRSARMISQMTGAYMLHASSIFQCFALNSDGTYQFVDYVNEADNSEVRDYSIKLTRNSWKWNGIRFISCGLVNMFAFICIILLNVLPMREVSNILFFVKSCASFVSSLL